MTNILFAFRSVEKILSWSRAPHVFLYTLRALSPQNYSYRAKSFEYLTKTISNSFRKILQLIILVLCVNQASFSEELPLPRFAAIKSSEVNMRTGPSVRFPIKYVFVKKGEPIEIVAQFEHWRKIRDIEGDEGWVHESMLSGKRSVIINSSKILITFAKASQESAQVFKIEPNTRANLISCNQDWCQIQVNSNKGWALKKYLWGVYSSEIIK